MLNLVILSVIKMSNPSKKRKIGDEHRVYHQRWESDYFITNTNGKLQCVLCIHVLSVPKEYNVKRHYTSLHKEKLKKYEGASRTALLEDYTKRLKQQSGLFTKVLKTQTSGLTASYAIALELAKTKQEFLERTNLPTLLTLFKNVICIKTSVCPNTTSVGNSVPILKHSHIQNNVSNKRIVGSS
jgi:hypothetical protein